MVRTTKDGVALLRWILLSAIVLSFLRISAQAEPLSPTGMKDLLERIRQKRTAAPNVLRGSAIPRLLPADA